MKKVIFLVLLMLVALDAAGDYSPPIGIPSPTWGINEALPARPDPWTSEVAGYYFIDHGSVSAVCTDAANSYGYPGHPRCTLPNPVLKGSYIEIAGAYNAASMGAQTVNAFGINAPNGNAWSAGSDGPAWITCHASGCSAIQTKWIIYGSYVYIDGMMFDRSILQVNTKTSFANSSTDHVLIRNSTFAGDESTKYVALAIFANAQGSTSNVIVNDNIFYNIGDKMAQTDLDPGAIQINPQGESGGVVSGVWILNNNIRDIGGSTIGLTGTGIDSSGQSRYMHHIYVGRNTITDSLVAGIGLKNGEDIILSENNISGIIDSSWSPGKCFGAQYDTQRLWIINNKCSKSGTGFRLASTQPGTTVFIIGNLFYDIDWRYHCTYTGCKYVDGVWTEQIDYFAALAIYGGTNVYIVNNTLYDISQGINFYGNARSSVTIENNIISSLNDAATGGHHIWSQQVSNIYVRNNILYDAAGVNIRWGSGTTHYTTIAGFESAINDATKATGNLSSDPTFVSTETPDLALQSDSPAKGAGIASASLSFDVYAAFNTDYSLAITKDKAGTTRPQDTTWDMGAYEYTEGGAPDTTPPMISSPLPSGAQSCTSNPRNVAISVATDEAATCKYGTTDTAYASLPNTFSTTGSTSHSQTVSNACGASYTYYVRCQDGSGNPTLTSTAISYSVATAGLVKYLPWRVATP